MKNQKLNPQSLESLASNWGIDFQVFKIKFDLIDAIKEYCSDHHVSQRKLASMFPGLTQDRVSKIFSGQVGHMTIDKLVEIRSALKIKVALRTKAA
jgi:predicted XRE-type DNA-binding protein